MGGLTYEIIITCQKIRDGIARAFELHGIDVLESTPVLFETVRKFGGFDQDFLLPFSRLCFKGCEPVRLLSDAAQRGDEREASLASQRIFEYLELGCGMQAHLACEVTNALVRGAEESVGVSLKRAHVRVAPDWYGNGICRFCGSPLMEGALFCVCCGSGTQTT